ncbi:MAG: putative transcriptional regulator [uncultured bacterium (gcode 4)]|uniref:Putative transcriptional regulator n=1 Tax=uncultured bacterium (gcode 4) TaxID=1234023 RepID=K2GES8_9BACT|nr:MAG: putative transcriptional regulator [uncultured bacterium (gcode 4)]
MNLAKLFGSNCRAKILEKFVLEYKIHDDNAWFFIRELCRDIDEQINSVRRELINLEELKILRSKEDNKKKFYFLNKWSIVFNEIVEIFIKNYDVMEELNKFFKWRKNIELITVAENIVDLQRNSTNVVDIFVIWIIDKVEFNDFLARTFFWRKIKYAVMSEDDFQYRLSYNDKLVLNILHQKWNLFLKDKLKIQETMTKKAK